MAVQRTSSHGGDIYGISREYGIDETQILDFSANINPFGLPESLKKALIDNIDNLVNYPDPHCRDLKLCISNYLEIPEENIVVGNGASEVIFLLFEILKPGKVLIPAPTFSEYSKAASSSGAEIEYLRLREENEFKLDIDELKNRLTDDINALVLCNPNNPTSTLIEREHLLEIVEFASERSIHVIIDEAFIELTQYSNKNSVANLITKYSNLFVFRAFTKLFAMPGLRLGYGLGNNDIITKMWQKKLSWSVNLFACCIGKVLLCEQEYLDRTCLWISEEKNWLYNELGKIKKLKVFKPQTNFILIKIQDDFYNAALLKDKMIRRGILIRNASSFEFLNEKFFRVAIKDRTSNTKLVNMLKTVLE